MDEIIIGIAINQDGQVKGSLVVNGAGKAKLVINATAASIADGMSAIDSLKKIMPEKKP